MKTVAIAYGSGSIALEVPEATESIAPNSQAPCVSEDELLEEALDRPLASPPLQELARGKRNAVILIACRTRRTGSDRYLKQIVRRLVEAGIPEERITVITATGTHDNFREQDAELLLGRELVGRVGFEGHDCDTPEKHACVGTTSRGTEVWLSKRYLDADLRIATGRVTYHYFAGFSGGRKAVLPGVSRKTTVRRNHSMAVLYHPEVRLNPATAPGVLDGNPIHEDMLEAARFVPPDFSLNTVLNTSHQITHAFGGELETSHRAAVRIVEQFDRVHVESPYDWMILSAGGAPYDVNGIQAIKALIGTYQAVRPGGTIFFFAECPEGIPEWLLQATEVQDPRLLRERIASGTLILGHNALWLEQIRRHCRIVMVTELSPATVERLGFQYAKADEVRGQLSRLTVESTHGVIAHLGNLLFATS
ncbi:Transcriptional regulator [Candidatus Sumerlaea chitinivorans]|uniref:Transcriptional regulator n=1 Tax=Sumerlaea chitinivorans TaxID=2250252 RepID=A0A2Z4Y633_SUMC1|nr:Transcriptional regulator [Candidatus Sumerlaea chitinivorans]